MITVAIDSGKRYLTTCSTPPPSMTRWDFKKRQLAHLGIGLRWGVKESEWVAACICYTARFDSHTHTRTHANAQFSCCAALRAYKSIPNALKLPLLTSCLCIWPWMTLPPRHLSGCVCEWIRLAERRVCVRALIWTRHQPFSFISKLLLNISKSLGVRTPHNGDVCKDCGQTHFVLVRFCKKKKKKFVIIVSM